ncbi:MAG: Gfo/Idh/MocA family oxidoreductase [Armatimonadia bacterium]
MKIGVIGVNHPHAGGHLQALEGAPEVERLLIWGEDEASARKAVENSAKAELAGSPEEIVGAGDVPAVCIFVKDNEAGPRNLEAIRAGKWVYGDKPGAQTTAELGVIVQAARETGAHFCPCYANRAMPMAREIARTLQDGAVGKLWAFNCQWITSQVTCRGADSWLFHKEYSAGGILTWLGCHWIDLLRMMFACEVTEVTAMVATQTAEAVDVEDTASVVLKFENGAIGTVRAGYGLRVMGGYDNSDFHFQFEGSEGALTWYPKGTPAGYRLRTINPRYSSFGVSRDIVIEAGPGKGRPGYAGDFLAEFLAAVRGEGELSATEVDAWQVLRVIEAAYEASATGTRVVLAERP